MINNSVLSEIRSNLECLGFTGLMDLVLKEYKEECIVFNFYDSDKVYEIRYYEDNNKHLIDNYVKMEKYGITPFKYMVEKSIVVYEIYGLYKELSLSDLNDEEIVVNLAKFYKKLHSINFDCNVKKYCFNRENLMKIMTIFNLKNSECLTYLYNNSKNVELKINRLKTCLLCGGFCLGHLVVLEKSKEIFLKDLDKLEKGIRGFDLNDLFNSFSKEIKNKFLEIYGMVSGDEIILSKVETLVKELIFASQENSLPSWIRDSLALLENKSFLRDIKCLVEWY